MFNRFCFGVLLLAGLALPFTGCDTSTGLDSITVSPATAAMVVGGPTVQLTATGTFGNGNHPSSRNITSQVTWTSSSPDIAEVGATTGLVTAKVAGTATIVATATGFNGPVSSSATITVTGGSGTNTGSTEGLVSLTIVPSTITVDQLQDTGNFLAIATYTTEPYIRDVTNSVVWTSSFPNAFPVDSNTSGDTSTGGTLGAPAGIVTAYGSGTANIIAEVTDPNSGSIQYAQASFSCPYVAPCPCTVEQGCSTPVTSCPNGPVAGSCFPTSQSSALLSTITVYNEGLNTTDWVVTAPSATGTADVIHCGPGWTGAGGSVCVATYPIGTPFVLTAPAGAGAFGGWSSNCTPVVSPTDLTPTTITASGPNYCELDPTTSNETVGAIFN